MLPNVENLHIVRSYQGTPAGAVNGAAVPVGDQYYSCVAVFLIGTGATVTALSIQADDDGDGSGWVALGADDYDGGPLPQTPAAGSVVKVGIRGGQRGFQTALRAVATSTGGPVAAFFILGHARHAPAGDPNAHRVFIT